MMIERRALIAHCAYTSLLTAFWSGCARPQTTAPSFTPEAFGAKGDGRTDDTHAFQKLSAAVNAAGGGTIVLSPKTYLVGRQRPARADEGFAFAPEKLLQLTGCTRALVIDGNGATIRCRPGLRYGSFDRMSGRRIDPPMPFLQHGALATPYLYMVLIENCTGGVTVRDLELDGNAEQLTLGGRWGDTGWQVPAVGLFLRNNPGDEIVRNLHTHHHAQDGLMIAGSSAGRPNIVKSLADVRSDHNGRQGCSVIGGHGYRFERCRFTNTGRGAISSAPGAGVDIEAEIGPVRNLRFSQCEFVDNEGCGMVADSGDSADVRFEDCRFVGTTNWSAWPNKPGYRFARCEFVGAVVRCFGSNRPDLATQFLSCRFTDEPARSPNKKVYRNGPMVNLSDSQNVLFRGCVFLATHGAQLPWSIAAVFDGCTMRQQGSVQAFPRGRYIGKNSIAGSVDIGASKVQGSLLLNGAIVPPR